MQITIHIGLEKTGTSTIQGLLNDRRSALVEQGVLFPVSPGRSNQTTLVAAAMSSDLNIRAHAIDRFGPDFATKLVSDLRAEIAAAGVDRLLLSSEHCSARLRTIEEVRRLKEILDTFGTVTKVIVYLRRQDEFLLSIYSTSIKAGSTKPFAIPAGHRHIRYDYRALIELWSGVFGRETMRPRLFQPSAWVGGDLLADFCDAADLRLEKPEAPVRNESLSAEALELVRRIRQHSGGGRDRALVAAAIAVTTGPKLSLSSDARREFVGRFDEQNRWVAETYFGRRDLFEDVPAELADHPLPELSAERFATLRRAVETALSGEAVASA